MTSTQSENSLRTPESLILGVSAIFGAAVILSNPVVGLPIAGTISVVIMMLSIDGMYGRLSQTADGATESTPSGSA